MKVGQLNANKHDIMALMDRLDELCLGWGDVAPSDILAAYSTEALLVNANLDKTTVLGIGVFRLGRELSAKEEDLERLLLLAANRRMNSFEVSETFATFFSRHTSENSIEEFEMYQQAVNLIEQHFELR